jgi:hypothetical protein
VDGAAVARQVLEAIEPVGMVDRQMGDRLRLGKADVDRDPPPTIGFGPERPPVGDTAAGRAEMEAELAVAADVDVA